MVVIPWEKKWGGIQEKNTKSQILLVTSFLKAE